MITRFAELNQYRVKGYVENFTVTGPFSWVPQQHGSFLKINAGGTAQTISISVVLPSSPSPPTGTRLWVEFYQGGGGGSWINWASYFKFQTVGDQSPNLTVGKTTIWTGIYGVGVTDCFMTKLGEW